MTQLAAAFDSACRQGGIVGGVMGEAGPGKSRLIAEVRRTMNTHPHSLARREITVLSNDHALRAPFVNLLAASVRPAGRAKAGPVFISGQVERYLPRPRRRTGSFPAQPLGLPIIDKDAELVQFLEPPVLRGRVFEAIVAWIEALAAEQPTVLYLDDVHWIDPTSLDLQGASPTVERMPLMILLAFRPRRETRRHFLAKRLGNPIPNGTRYRPQAARSAQGRALVGNCWLSKTCGVHSRPHSGKRLRAIRSFWKRSFVLCADAGLVEQQTDTGGRRPTSLKFKFRYAHRRSPPGSTASATSTKVLQAASVLGRDFDFDTLAGFTGRFAPAGRPLDDSPATRVDLCPRRRPLVRSSMA